eukprot:scpid85308/ scgid31258/ 
MKFCPGILNYGTRFPDVRFESKNLRKWDVPYSRVDAQACKLWYQLPSNSSLDTRGSEHVQCKECSQLERNLATLQTRAAGRSDEEQKKRVSASSTVPLKYLSPQSQSARLGSVRQESHQVKRECSRLQHLYFTMSHSQSAELESVCKTIQSAHQEDMDEVVAELDGKDKQDAVRDAWKQDVVSKQTFNHDQLTNTTGDRGNRWSMLTYRMALAVFTRSRSAYEALKSFKILQLPSIRSLQHFTCAHNDKPGWCEDSILSQRKRYEQFCKKRIEDGHKKPVSDGILI